MKAILRLLDMHVLHHCLEWKLKNWSVYAEGGGHRPEDVGQQRGNFWPARASLCRVVTFKS